MHQVVGCRLRRGVGVGGQGESAAAEDFQSEVSAAFGPFIGLLGQDRADEPDDGLSVGEDHYSVGAAPDLAIEPFIRVVRPDLSPDVIGESGEHEQVLTGVTEMVGDLGQPKIWPCSGL